MAGSLPRALLGPGLCAWGFLVAKLAAAVLLVDAGTAARVLPAFAGGFLGDAVITGWVLALAHASTRIHPPLRSVAGLVVDAVGAGLGLYAVLNVYLVAAYGSPLTAAMLAYRQDADIVGQWAPLPLAALACALGAFLLLGLPVARALAQRRPQQAAAVLSALAAGGLVVPTVDHEGAIRALGLDRNAVGLLVTSALPLRTDGDEADPDVRWDAPWPAPADARFTAPVVVDTSRGRPRHVVLWLAESIATRHTTVGGSHADTTPRLAELSRHALRFAHYAANAPISAKAIFTTLCGYYPLPDPEFETRKLPRIACPSLMETLTSNGWDAALFHGGYFAFTDKLSLLEERGFSLLLDGESMPGRDRWFTNGWGIDDAALVERGLAWLDEREDPARPTLAVYIPLVPHYEYFLPPSAPRPFGERTLLDRYRNGVHYTDALFGRLVDAYAARGLLDDTLFVFVGDHGEAFEEHPRNKLHAGFLYEENVQAPLVFISPRLFPQPQVSERLGSHVDLAPTILSLLGVPGPPSLQGQSLVEDAFRYRPTFLGTWYPDPLLGLRDGDVKYILHLRSGAEELYDLARDPGERRNLAPVFPERTSALRARVRSHEREQRRFLLEHPARGDGYLDRVFDALDVAVVDGEGRETSCARSNKPSRIECDGGLWVGLLPERVFNMERRCLRVHPPAQGHLRLRARLEKVPSTVGLGLTDRARSLRGEPLEATFRVAGHDAVTLRVDDRFESSSRVRMLGAPRARDADAVPAGAAFSLEVELGSAGGRDRSACLSFAP